MNVKISAIVCTLNRSWYLKKAIQSLVDQTVPQGEYEIIVVDNASTDDTKSVVESFRHVLNLRYVHEPVLGLSRARNTGWQNALGRYVAYLDDDAMACPTWLERILHAFENVKPTPGTVGGRITLIWETERPDWLARELETPLGYLDWGCSGMFLTQENQWLGGGNLACPRKILEEAGGFSTDLGRKGKNLLSNDEILLTRYLRSQNLGSYYDPAVLVQHHVLPERVQKGWFYRRYFWQGISREITAYLETGHGRTKITYLGLAILSGLRLIAYSPILLSILMPIDSKTRVLRRCSFYACLGQVRARASIGFGKGRPQ